MDIVDREGDREDADREDVVDLLRDQHAQIKELLATVAAAPISHRQRPFNELIRLLALHETAEEELVHPATRRYVENGEAIVESRLTEERRTKQELVDLFDLGVDHDEFDERLRVLRDVVVDHAEHEEHDEFPKLRSVLDADRLCRMAKAVRVAEAAASSPPRPGIEGATASVGLGPPLAVFDGVRNAIRQAAENASK